MSGLKTLGLGAVLSIALTSPAVAANKPITRLVNCGSQSCLMVSGQREDMSSSVRINGHEVAAKGKHRWRVRVPVQTVSNWSAPFARTVSVSVDGATHHAKLPVGMMGHADLAMLIVRVK